MGGKRLYAGESVLIVYIGDLLFLLSATFVEAERIIGCMLEVIGYRVQLFVPDRCKTVRRSI